MHHTGLYRISKLTRGTARAQLHFHWHRPRHTWRQAYVPQLPDGMVSSQTPEDISPTKPENRWTVKQKNSRNPFLLIAVFEIMDAAWFACLVGLLLTLVRLLLPFALDVRSCDERRMQIAPVKAVHDEPCVERNPPHNIVRDGSLLGNRRQNDNRLNPFYVINIMQLSCIATLWW